MQWIEAFHQIPRLHGCHLQNLAHCLPHNSLLLYRAEGLWCHFDIWIRCHTMPCSVWEYFQSLEILFQFISSLWKFFHIVVPTMPSQWKLTFQCNLNRRQSSNEGTNKWISQRELSSLLLTSVRANRPFLAKVIEKVVAVQIHSYLVEKLLMPSMQSAYRKHHLTETALLQVMNAVLRTADCRQDVVLVILDLAAAFDTLDLTILLDRQSR